MKSLFFSLLTFLTITGIAPADVLSQLPGPPGTPMTQGGMVHINVTFLDDPTNPFEVHVDAGLPDILPLSSWEPGDTLDPTEPWYTALDPTQEARAFSGRYGFLMDPGSDLLPDDKSLGIRLLNSSEGLEFHFYRFTEGSEAFQPVFTPSKDHVLWNGNMWHPVVTTPAGAGGILEAEFELFVADAALPDYVDWTTIASPDSSYAPSAPFTLQFAAIPEPHVLTLLALGFGIFGIGRFIRTRSQS